MCSTKEAKSIETLKGDLEEILLNGLGRPLSNDDTEVLKVFTEACTEALKRVLEGISKGRDKTLRMSNIGYADRKLWYTLNGSMKEPYPPNMAMKFFIGHITEAAIIALVKLSGHKVSHEQHEVSIDGITGHSDLVIDGVMVDVKSASNHAYTDKFLKRNVFLKDDFGYVTQLSGYSEGTGIKRCAFLPINKVTGEFDVIEFPEGASVDVKDRVARVKSFINSPTPPDLKCHEVISEKNGNVKLPYSCKYCDYKMECWQGSNGGKGLRVFKYSDGDQYFTHVEKEPRVEEITQEYKASLVPNKNKDSV